MPYKTHFFLLLHFVEFLEIKILVQLQCWLAEPLHNHIAVLYFSVIWVVKYIWWFIWGIQKSKFSLNLGLMITFLVQVMNYHFFGPFITFEGPQYTTSNPHPPKTFLATQSIRIPLLLIILDDWQTVGVYLKWAGPRNLSELRTGAKETEKHPQKNSS